MIWASDSAVKAPVARKPAKNKSRKPENWITPLPMTAGKNFETISRTAFEPRLTPSLIEGETLITTGIWTRNWSAPPTRTPHAAAFATDASDPVSYTHLTLPTKA